jgi:hypothetical protein
VKQQPVSVGDKLMYRGNPLRVVTVLAPAPGVVSYDAAEVLVSMEAWQWGKPCGFDVQRYIPVADLERIAK